jgi:hypothetical protein
VPNCGPFAQDVHRLDAAGILGQLVLVAKVDDRSHAIRAERIPAGRAEAIDGVGSD